MSSRDREDLGWGYAARGPGRGSPLVVMVALIVGAISSAVAVLALVGEPQGNSTAGAPQAPIATTANPGPRAQTGPAPDSRQSDDAALKRVASPPPEPVPAAPTPSTAPASSAKTSAAKSQPAKTSATRMSPAQTDIDAGAAVPAKPETGLETMSALEQAKSQADITTNKDVTTIKGADDAPPHADRKLNLSARFSTHRHSRWRNRYYNYRSTFSRVW